METSAGGTGGPGGAKKAQKYTRRQKRRQHNNEKRARGTGSRGDPTAPPSTNQTKVITPDGTTSRTGTSRLRGPRELP
ncbi:hypothetical protein GDO81_018939 [Engystomops pustulosus]|uniref:Uncharacterized protein n=1 Tax=Engystomops pustulosus TaxID=76066 RepID=A0AAV6YH09_ENGPU|nr:hypothetical protein GDO81_018939 [Engystomops pustulosus]